MAMGGGIPSDAPANTTSENEAFGGSTDQEKFNFCSSFIEVVYDWYLTGDCLDIIDTDPTGDVPVPGTYKGENYTVTFKMSATNYTIDATANGVTLRDGSKIWGTINGKTTPDDNTVNMNLRVQSNADTVFDFVYKETMGGDGGTYILNGYEIPIKETSPR